MTSPNALPNPESTPGDLSPEDKALLHDLIKKFVGNGGDVIRDDGREGYEREIPEEYLEAQGLDCAVLVSDVTTNRDELPFCGFCAIGTATDLVQVYDDGPFEHVEGTETKMITLTEIKVDDIDFGITIGSHADAIYDLPNGSAEMQPRHELTVPEIQAVMRALQTALQSGTIPE